jgi:hypothetical protein
MGEKVALIANRTEFPTINMGQAFALKALPG